MLNSASSRSKLPRQPLGFAKNPCSVLLNVSDRIEHAPDDGAGGAAFVATGGVLTLAVGAGAAGVAARVVAVTAAGVAARVAVDVAGAVIIGAAGAGASDRVPLRATVFSKSRPSTTAPTAQPR